MKKDAFGHYVLIKRMMYLTFGFIVWMRFRFVHHATVENSKVLSNLPQRNVLFVSNHQTYFADVSLMLSSFFYHRKGKKKERLGWPTYLFYTRPRVYFIAAFETMKAGLLPKLMGKAGAILVKRTWRSKGQSIKREVDKTDQNKVGKALNDGWVITFPQGTTKPYAKGRKGTAHLIKEFKPVVVPVVINGMRRAFDKKGLFIKKRGIPISMIYKEPLNIDYNADVDVILDQIMDAIEQSEKYYPKSLEENIKKNING